MKTPKLTVKKIAPNDFEDAVEISVPPYSIIGKNEAIPLYDGEQRNPNGGWQYHKSGFREEIRVVEGRLLIEVSKLYGLSDTIRDCELTLGTPQHRMPELIVHRLVNPGPVEAKVEIYFGEPWDQNREPIFETEEEAWNSLADYLKSEEFRRDFKTVKF